MPTQTLSATPVYSLRIVDPDNAASKSISIKKFRLSGKLDLTLLDSAAATYKVGQAVSITFHKDGVENGSIFNDVKIQYSNDNFSSDVRAVLPGGIEDVFDITAAGGNCPAGNCTYVWTVPNNAGLTSAADYYVRVLDPQNSDLSGYAYGADKSSFKFKLRGDFSFGGGDHPALGDKWGVDSVHAVSWSTQGLVSNVKLAFSDNFGSGEKFLRFNGANNQLEEDPADPNFAGAQSISNTANGAESYDWKIPDYIRSGVMLRIYDATDAAVYLDSPAFKIFSVISNVTPGSSANEVYKAGQSGVNLSWDATGTVPGIKLEYAFDNVPTWQPILPAQSGSVTDVNGNIAGNPGSITWTLPQVKSNNAFQGKVRISWLDGAQTVDTDSTVSNTNPFKVSAAVTISAPNGENAPLWKVGETTHQITWATIPANVGGSNQVDIYYSINGFSGPFNLVQNGNDTANDGTFDWTIPDSVSNNVVVQVVDALDSDGDDRSDAVFSIAGDLKIQGGSDAPLGGEKWPIFRATPAALATVNSVKWTSTGSLMNQVALHASNDGFNAVDIVVASGLSNVVGQNTYGWQVSDSVSPITTIGSGWVVKVVNTTAGTPPAEVTSGAFDITAGFYMSSHNTTADRCLVGNLCTIRWDTAGSVSDVIVEYSLNGAAGPWTAMHVGSTLGANPGFINWPVPGGLLPNVNARYRVSDGVPTHPAASDMTNGNTIIGAEFPGSQILLSPSGQPLAGRTFSVGEAVTISYTYSSTVAAVDVEYSLDADNNLQTFDNPVKVVNAQATNGNGTGTFTYTFGDLMDQGADVTRIRFRVVDSAVPDDDPANTTNGVTGTFKLKGPITVSSPNVGTERWQVGSAQTITWTNAASSISNVKIEYDDNTNFTSPTVLVASTSGTPKVGGSYNFTVNSTNFPDIAALYHNDIFIRVSDADTTIHGLSNDKSDNGMIIVGKIDFTQPSSAPQLGDNWSLGLPHTITWTTTGQVSNVDIYYSKTGLFADAQLINSQITSGECDSGPHCANNPNADTSVSWIPLTSLDVANTAVIWIVDADDNTTPQDLTYQLRGNSFAFNLHGSVTFNGTLVDGQKLKAGTSRILTWDTFGDLLNSVDIQYSRDNDTNPATFDNPQPVVMGYDNSAGGGQRGTYTWTVPSTFNDGTVYLRIIPTSSTAGEDISGAFKIMPNIQISAPSNGDGWSISLPVDIRWSITGIVNQIKIRYSIDGGSSYPSGSPYEIITLNPNQAPYALSGASAKYTWAAVADTSSTNAKMKLELLDDGTGDADAEMTGSFSIQSLFQLNSPAAHSVYEVGGTFDLNWDWAGTIPFIMVEYSDTYDGVDPATFDAGAKCMNGTAPPCLGALLLANGNGNSGTGYSPSPVTVPNNISRPGDARGEYPFYIRISDPNNTNTNSIAPSGAGNGFKIKSRISLTSPNGGEDLYIGNLTHNVVWTSSGTVPNVVLEYSDDNFVSHIYCVNGGTAPNCTALANQGSYAWKILDDERLVKYTCNTTPVDSNPNDTMHPCKNDTVKIRVKDSLDVQNLDSSSADFTARYVAKRWSLRDSVKGSELNSIAMYEHTIHKTRAFSNQSVLGIFSPYIIWSPAGTNYSVGFSKTGYTDFTDTAQTTTLTDQLPAESMVDEEQIVYMQSTVAHNDVINTEFNYTPALNGQPDKIVFKVWYSRDGLNVVTTTQAHLRIYDNNVMVPGMDLTSNLQEPAASGVYKFTIANTGLQLRKNYTARNLVALAGGIELEGFDIINITEQSERQTMTAHVAEIAPKIVDNLDRQVTTEFNSLDQKLDDLQSETLNKIGDTGAGSLVDKMDQQTATIQTAITDFTNKSDDAVARMQDEITKAGIRLIIPATVKLGSSDRLRVGTVPLANPTLDLLCPDGSPIYQALSMLEISPGIYASDVKFDGTKFRCAAAKAVTVIATAIISSNNPEEPPFEARAIGSMFMTTTDLDTIQGLAAAGLNAEKAAKDAKDAMRSVATAVGSSDGDTVRNSLGALQQSIGLLTNSIKGNKDEEGVGLMRSTVDDIANRLTVLMGNEGVNVRELLQQSMGQEVKGVRNKVDRTLAVTEVMKQIVERKIGQSEEPVVETFYEIGSVKMRVVAVNPSETKPQKVPIKIYLPQEVIPEDIIDMGELKVGYDSDKQQYFAFSEGVELKPKEMRVFEVHLEDIWVIPDAELGKRRDEARLALTRLEKTAYFDKARLIVNSIYERLDEIKERQENQVVSREEHIGAYRINEKTVKKIDEDLAKIEKLLGFIGAEPSVEFLKEAAPQKEKTNETMWLWIILATMVALIGITGIGYYVRWYFSLRAERRAKIQGAEMTAQSVEEFADGDKNKPGPKPDSGGSDEIQL